MINVDKILSTLNMFEKEKLDCRTITMGISLSRLRSPNGEIARQRMYDKITQKAENLVSVGESIEKGVWYSHHSQENFRDSDVYRGRFQYG